MADADVAPPPWENGGPPGAPEDAPGASQALVAAGEVRTPAPALPAPDLGDLRLKPATQTKAIGIIQPPPDIRAIVDKTAEFVARNGLDFEKRILANEKNNLKFNFLVPGDPYNAYYKTKIADFSDGEVLEKPAASESALAEPQQKQVEEVAKVAAPAAAKTLEEPEPEDYTVHVPEGLTAQDLDIIKLVAQFVARNGKTFLSGLANREHSNPQFNFLKPTHSMFTFFTALADTYSKVLMPPTGIIQKLMKDTTDRTLILERALKRLEWDRAREKEQKEAADIAERERMVMQMIDWHNFVVVETIDFHDDEDADLPPPMSLKDVLALNKARPFEHEAEGEAGEEAANAHAEDEEMEMEMDEEEKALVAEANAAAEKPAVSAPEKKAPDEPSTAAVVQTVEEDDEPIRVVKNYVRPKSKDTPSYDPGKFAVSPITGELVRIEEMEEHMRVSLIDPRWKEQREAMLAKIRETTKAHDDEIGRNLVMLAKTRPDIFGSTQEEVSQAVRTSIKEKMMSGSNRPVVWDGVTQSGQGLETQLKAINDSRQERKDTQPVAPDRRAQMGPPGLRPPMPMRPAVPGGSMMGAMHNRPPPMTNIHSQQRPHSSELAGQPPQQAPRPPPIPMVPRSMVSANTADEPEAKKARLEFVLRPEEEFLMTESAGPAKVRVQCPKVDGNPELRGQMLEVEVASLRDTVGQFKARLATVLGLPANKQKLGRDGVGFLMDEFSLAHYNVSARVVLNLDVKMRGGRKKA
ncbi:unnamed protein product [Ostreobium quekettii]|uniref:Splicing factor 3A subunit 1 n=1 Tax=Ostreobium quekettii TaxID=121088 RepID=A0A8S1IR92_9CHLO|nr:unnamed protein product [Ostreobium quekettii]|eukprot:evm.model.scf_43EXC.5 EVM.evm.TU.scf_43EXC.5   scf_43EXC:37576-48372(+)